MPPTFRALALSAVLICQISLAGDCGCGNGNYRCGKPHVDRPRRNRRDDENRGFLRSNPPAVVYSPVVDSVPIIYNRSIMVQERVPMQRSLNRSSTTDCCRRLEGQIDQLTDALEKMQRVLDSHAKLLEAIVDREAKRN